MARDPVSDSTYDTSLTLIAYAQKTLFYPESFLTGVAWDPVSDSTYDTSLTLIAYAQKPLLPQAIPHRLGSGTGSGLNDTYITLIAYAQNLIPHRRGSGTGTGLHDTSLTICCMGDFEKKNGRIMEWRCPPIRLSVHPSENNLQDIIMIFYENVYSVKTKCPTQECLSF